MRAISGSEGQSRHIGGENHPDTTIAPETGGEPKRLGPGTPEATGVSVFEALRRYIPALASAILIGALVSAAYTYSRPPSYLASAELSLQPPSASARSGGGYLDSQVLLLRSEELAASAVKIGNAATPGQPFRISDFYGERRSVQISPPALADPNAYGSSIVTISFSASDPTVARAGAEAVIQAYSQVRRAAIEAERTAALGRIEQTLAKTTDSVQRKALAESWAQTALSFESQLAAGSPVAWSTPQTPVNRERFRSLALGGVVALLLCGFGFYWYATWRRPVTKPSVASAVYGAPVLASVSVPKRRRRQTSWKHRLRGGAVDSVIQASPKGDLRDAAAMLDRVYSRTGEQSIVFLSPHATWERDYVLGNLALSLSNLGRRVMVVDVGLGPDVGSSHVLMQPVESAHGLGAYQADDSIQANKTATGVRGPAASPLSATLWTLSADSPEALQPGLDILQNGIPQQLERVILNAPPTFGQPDAFRLIESLSLPVVLLVGLNEPLSEHRELAVRTQLEQVDILGVICWQSERSA